VCVEFWTSVGLVLNECRMSVIPVLLMCWTSVGRGWASVERVLD